jgi:hypothetical protein
MPEDAEAVRYRHRVYQEEIELVLSVAGPDTQQDGYVATLL